MAHPNRLENARVLIFGGTSGIGFGVANLVLANGGYVIISGSGQPKVDDKVAKLRSFYPNLPADRVSGHAVDLLDSANLEKNLTILFDKVTDNGAKKIDHITFTAGDIPDLPKIENVDIESAMHGFKIRYLGPVIIAKLLKTGKYVPFSPNSSLTTTGGTNTKKPMPGWAIAAAWGASLEGLTRGLAVDLSPIRVNIVIPGAIQTELLQRFIERIGPEATDKLKNESGLLGTFGQPEDTAEAYGWIMRDRFVTGSQASTDGGRLLAHAGQQQVSRQSQ